MNRTIVLTLCILTSTVLLAGCSSSGPTTHLRVDFGGVPPTADADLPFDPASRPADAYYKRSGMNHSAYTAFDQLVQWADATHTPVEIQSFSWGDCLGRIAGVPAIASCDVNATAYWILNVNGADAMEGMGTYVLRAGDRVTWTLTPASVIPSEPQSATSGSGSPGAAQNVVPAPAGGDLLLVAPPFVETTDGVVDITGTASAGAALSFAVQANIPVADKGDLVRDGEAWALHMELPDGATAATITFTADDGVATTSATTRLVRLGQGVFVVDYKGVETAREDTVWYDWTNHTSAPMYETTDVTHPDYYTVHDFMAAWSEQTGVPIVMSYYDGVGYFVNSIDGVGTPGTIGDTTGAGPWCYNLNGTSADLGISQQAMQPGDVVEWVLGCA